MAILRLFSRRPALRRVRPREGAPPEGPSEIPSETQFETPPPPAWVEAAPEGHRFEGVEPRPLAQAEDWSLVLTAREVPHRVRHGADGWRVEVLAADRFRAEDELTRYVRENRGWRRVFAGRKSFANSRWTLLALGSLLLVYALTNTVLPGLKLYPGRWYDLGAAVSADILAGEWWRAVTALTLHADPAHVLGNVVIGAAFVVPVCSELGLGLGLLLVVFSGIGGGLMNAFFQQPAHSSIGFSTAVFGAAGLISSLRAVLGHQLYPGRSWAVPVVAGLSLLALLGVGGENTDVGAHLFGFVAGLGLGLGAATLVRRGVPGRAWQIACGAVAFGLPAYAWLRAFGA